MVPDCPWRLIENTRELSTPKLFAIVSAASLRFIPPDPAEKVAVTSFLISNRLSTSSIFSRLIRGFRSWSKLLIL